MIACGTVNNNTLISDETCSIPAISTPKTYPLKRRLIKVLNPKQKRIQLKDIMEY